MNAPAFRSAPVVQPTRYRLDANPRVASPLFTGVAFAFLWPILSLPIAVALIVAGAFLQIKPAIACPLAFLLALGVAALIYWRYVKHYCLVQAELYPDEIVLSTCRTMIAISREGRDVGVESREWTSPRTTGHNTWTILTLWDGSNTLTIGAPCLFQRPSGRTGQPQLIASPEVLRDLAEQMSVDLTKQWVLPERGATG